MPQYIDTVEILIATWKNNDIEGVLKLLHEQVEYYYLISKEPLQGKDQVRQFLQTFGQGQTEKRWQIFNYAQDGDKLLVEGVDDYINADGIRIQIPYMGIFEFNDGLIYRWRDYADTAMIAVAKKGEALPEHVQRLMA